MKFSIPSFSQVAHSATSTFSRFPVILIVSIIGTVAGIWSVNEISPETELFPTLLKALFVSSLGISLLFGLDIHSENSGYKGSLKWALRAIGVLLLVIYYIVLGDSLDNGPDKVLIQFLLFALASHLFVSFSPFLNQGERGSVLGVQ